MENFPEPIPSSAEVLHNYRDEILAEYTHRISFPIRKVNKLDYDLDETEREQQNESNLTSILENRDLLLGSFREPGLESIVLNNLLELVYMKDRVASNQENPKTVRGRLAEFGLEMLAELSPDIVVATRNGALGDFKGFGALQNLSEEGNDEQKVIAVTALTNLLPEIRERLEKENTSRVGSSAVRSIFKHGTYDQAMEAGAVLSSVIEHADPASLPLLVSAFYTESAANDLLIDLGFRAVTKILEDRALSYLDLSQAWIASTSSKKWEYAIHDNLKAVIELEKALPGACATLMSEFGVHDFGRYPVELLLRQVKEKDDLSKPYGVILYPEEDWNGAFYQGQEMFKKLFDTVENEFSLRVMECDGRIDVARALITLNKRYNPEDGSGHKIELAILGGHGDGKSLLFGGNDERHKLSTKDLTGGGVLKARTLFAEGPTIVLVSCHAGEDGGIGYELSVLLNAKVIAPNKATNISELYASKNEGQDRFRFNAKFIAEDSTTVFTQGVNDKK